MTNPTNPTSRESPWPVRTVAMKIAEWVARLGEVWVEGQVTQLNRRGNATELFAHYEAHRPKGEIVLLISGRGD